MLCLTCENSKYPAFKDFHINLVNFLSEIFISIKFINLWWSMESKHLEMSPSIIQVADWNFWLTDSNAEWHPLLGLNP